MQFPARQRPAPEPLGDDTDSVQVRQRSINGLIRCGVDDQLLVLSYSISLVGLSAGYIPRESALTSIVSRSRSSPDLP
jgi:hypothetical protein